MTRVYLPTTLEDLARFVDQGYLPESTERYVAPGEDEESEYAALTAAAEASHALLQGAGRRVVVVAEVTDPDGTVALEQLQAVHADLADDADPDDDLAWFAAQEIPDLLGER
ncbi:DUF6912 family protein [Nocardioides nanhaiensis]|uniref:Uncharacterized protein n=1 Tax=Nocardioides nanhaiensis TaxID=1476871 RepID=A0ABP8X097_9ACTN